GFRDIGKGSVILINTFHELEPVYVHHLRKSLKIPVSAKGRVFPPKALCETGNASERGKMTDIREEELISLLDSQIPRLVMYDTFGSHCFLSQ
ncbi:hypothetical protein KI387_003033, partial [Taxus chinensis]